MVVRLGAFAAGLDSERYVPEPALAALVAELLEPDGLRAVVLHGPGGIGKSAALRHLRREAARQELRSALVDCRDLAETPGEISDRLAAIVAAAPDLLLVDEIDALGAAAQALRELIPELPRHSRIVLAGRTPPGRPVIPDGLPVREFRLASLAIPQSLEVLRRHGVEDVATATDLASWSRGFPLALVLGAYGAHAGDGGTAGPADLVDSLARRLARGDLPVDQETLRVAALARGPDRELLGDVLPECDPDRSLAELTGLPVVDTVDGRAVLHPLLASGVEELFRIQDPMRHRTLSMRVAWHLHDRALEGDPTAIPVLAELMRDPTLRQGIGLSTTERYFVDRSRVSDRDGVHYFLEAGEECWIDTVAQWLPDARTFVARSTTGRCVALSAILPATDGAEDDPLTGDLVRYARAAGIADRTVITPFQLALPRDDERTELRRFLGSMGLHRCGITNPRFDLVNGIGLTDADREVMRGFGYVELPELAREIAGRTMQVWMGDAGEEGFLGFLVRAVAEEHGIALGSQARRAAKVLEVLEHFHDDRRLAALDPVTGTVGGPDATAYLRRRVRRTVDRTLAGAHPQLHELVQVRYLSEDVLSHQEAMRRTYQSRSGYFRKLRQAKELIAAGA